MTVALLGDADAIRLAPDETECNLFTGPPGEWLY
jgi:hypothetical protein